MYAELSLKKLKICAEELEGCERRLKRDSMAFFEVYLSLAKSQYEKQEMQEILWKIKKQQEDLILTIGRVHTLGEELKYIVYLYEKCEMRVSKSVRVRRAVVKEMRSRWETGFLK